MDRQTFERIRDEAVAAGADLKDAELHIIRGYHLIVDGNGAPVLDSAQTPPVDPNAGEQTPPVDPNAGEQTPPVETNAGGEQTPPVETPV